jgi:MoxR-like ATPase
MFSINLTYPTFEEEVQVVKLTTATAQSQVDVVFSAEEILEFQSLIRKIPVADNVIDYAVKMVGKSRPASNEATPLVKQYVDWGAGPRASQNLILAAKTNAVINNKLSPDIEDVQSVAKGILRHRIIKNYKAESDGITTESIIENLF